MSDRKDIVEKIRLLILPLLNSEQIELVEIKLVRPGKGHLLRIFIDKQSGVTVGDCARISRKIGDLLDMEDPIKGRYTLEVSSPGVGRDIGSDSAG